MKKIISVLAIAFFIIFTACKNEPKQEEQTIMLVKPTVFGEKMAEHKGQIVDVRTEKEYKSGYIKDAINMHVYDADFEKNIETLDKDEPVYVYCKAGGRSAEAVSIMKDKGFKKIIELDGGMDAWLEAKKPLEQF